VRQLAHPSFLCEIPPPYVGSYRSATGDDFDDLESVSGAHLSPRKFGRCDWLAVVLDDDAAGQKLLGKQKVLDRAR